MALRGWGAENGAWNQIKTFSLNRYLDDCVLHTMKAEQVTLWDF